MTTAATSLLGLALPVTGELSGTWGDTVNNSITSLLDTAIAGTTTLSTDGDVTLSTTTLAANQARQAILLCSGARTAIRTITAPAQSKIYTIINATTGGYAVKIVGVGPTTGISIPAGQTATVAWNGSDFVDASNYTNGNKVINGNLSVTGSVTLSGGTANGVAYLNGSKVLTTGSALTFDGTTLGFGSTGQRITGDMSNATQANRLFFQNSISNSNTSIGVIPSGTATSARVNVFNSSSPDNASYCQLAVDAGTAYLQSSATGTGTALPMGFITGGSTRYQITTTGESVWSIGSEQMRLTSTGLGIGTSSPGYKLTVSGGATSLAANQYMRFGSQIFAAGDGSATNYLFSGPTSMTWRNAADSADLMYLSNSGNLGLGVTPSYRLDVAGAVSATPVTNGVVRILTTGANPATGYGGGLLFAQQNSGGTYSNYASITGSRVNNAANDKVDMVFSTGSPGDSIAIAERMRLDTSGNLGLGVTPISGARMSIGSSSNFPVLKISRTDASFDTGVLALGDGNSSAINVGVWRGAANSVASTGNWLNLGGYSGITFNTGNAAIGSQTQAMTLDASGNLLVGTTSAAGSSSVSIVRPANTANYIYMLKNTQLEMTMGCKSSTDTNFYIGSGSSSIGTNGVYLTAAGNSWNAVSDERTKTIVGSIENAADKVLNLRSVIGYYNHDEKQVKRPFLIAQDVQAVLPEAVSIADQETGTLGLSYTDVIPLLVAAIKEQQALITQLTERITALEAK